MVFFLTLSVGKSRFARTAGSTKIPLKVVDAERKKRKVPCDVVFRRPLSRRENEERENEERESGKETPTILKIILQVSSFRLPRCRNNVNWPQKVERGFCIFFAHELLLPRRRN